MERKFKNLIDKSTLERLYYDEGLTQRDIAREYGLTQPTIQAMMQYHNIRPKTRIEYDWKPTHEPKYKGVNWKRGVAPAIRIRDGLRCRHCGMTNDDHLAQTGYQLHVHHISPLVSSIQIEDYMYQNREDNLITLCVNCHTNAHLHIVGFEYLIIE